MPIIKVTRKELKNLKASNYYHGDIIIVDNKYWINIRYKNNEGVNFSIPALLSFVELENGKILDCTPGSSKGFTPYYIDDFKWR